MCVKACVKYVGVVGGFGQTHIHTQTRTYSIANGLHLLCGYVYVCESMCKVCWCSGWIWSKTHTQTYAYRQIHGLRENRLRESEDILYVVQCTYAGVVDAFGQHKYSNMIL